MLRCMHLACHRTTYNFTDRAKTVSWASSIVVGVLYNSKRQQTSGNSIFWSGGNFLQISFTEGHLVWIQFFRTSNVSIMIFVVSVLLSCSCLRRLISWVVSLSKSSSTSALIIKKNIRTSETSHTDIYSKSFYLHRVNLEIGYWWERGSSSYLQSYPKLNTTKQAIRIESTQCRVGRVNQFSHWIDSNRPALIHTNNSYAWVFARNKLIAISDTVNMYMLLDLLKQGVEVFEFLNNVLTFWRNQDCLHNLKATTTRIGNRRLVQCFWVFIAV